MYSPSQAGAFVLMKMKETAGIVVQTVKRYFKCFAHVSISFDYFMFML